MRGFAFFMRDGRMRRKSRSLPDRLIFSMMGGQREQVHNGEEKTGA